MAKVQEGPEGILLTTYSSCRTNHTPVIKRDKDHYIDKNGQVREYKKNVTKPYQSIRASMSNLYSIIVTNFNGNGTELFLTLTYDCLMNDTKKLSKDSIAFGRKLDKLNLSYIIIKEPHESSGWHLHVLVKRIDGKRLVLGENKLRKLWKHGYEVSQKRITDLLGLCNYLDVTKNTEKRDRIKYYPSSMQIFSYSKKCIKVSTKTMISKKAFKTIKDKNLTLVIDNAYDSYSINENGKIVFDTIHKLLYKGKVDYSA